MAYATTNQPKLLIGAFAKGANIWSYSSADTTTTIDNSGYITDGGHLGMKVGDTVIADDTTTPQTTAHRVISVSTTYPGAVDLSNGTVIGASTNSD